MSCHDVSSPNYNLIEVISSACDFSLKIIKIKEIHLKEGDVIYWNLIFSFPFWRNYWNLKLTFRSSTVQAIQLINKMLMIIVVVIHTTKKKKMKKKKKKERKKEEALSYIEII